MHVHDDHVRLLMGFFLSLGKKVMIGLWLLMKAWVHALDPRGPHGMGVVLSFLMSTSCG